MSSRKNVQNWLRRSLEDPISRILAKSSNLTKIQLETLLIDVLAENIALKRLKYEEKANFRQTKAAISRGSFNRTLQQAKKNVVQSIYTILLLGYLGVLEDVSLTPYLEVANKLKAYREAYRDLADAPARTNERLKIMNTLREELETILIRLSKSWNSINL